MHSTQNLGIPSSLVIRSVLNEGCGRICVVFFFELI